MNLVVFCNKIHFFLLEQHNLTSSHRTFELGAYLNKSAYFNKVHLNTILNQSI